MRKLSLFAILLASLVVYSIAACGSQKCERFLLPESTHENWDTLNHKTLTANFVVLKINDWKSKVSPEQLDEMFRDLSRMSALHGRFQILSFGKSPEPEMHERFRLLHEEFRSTHSSSLSSLSEFVKELTLEINQHVAPEEQGKIFPTHIELRAVEPLADLTFPPHFHFDGPYLVSTTSLIGEGTIYQPDRGSDYYYKPVKSTQKTYQTPTGNTLLFRGTSPNNGYQPLLHAAPTSAEPRLILIVGYERRN